MGAWAARALLVLMSVCAVVPFSLLVAAQQCAVGANGPQLYGYQVVAEFPHDARAFTQGLQFDTVCNQGRCKDVFWESTGQYGESTVRKVELASGRVLHSTPMDSRWFGEGMTRLGDRLYQITWLTNTGFIYSVPGLQRVGTFSTPLRDGWGITTIGRLLVVSDGSSKLTWLDPAQGFKAVKTVTVTDGNRRIGYLNELEYIDGEIWANIWQTECIARICPETGKVAGWVLMHGLAQSLASRGLSNTPMDVLNGVAHDATRKRTFITGKYWPRVFEITTRPLSSNANNLALRNSCYLRSRHSD